MNRSRMMPVALLAFFPVIVHAQAGANPVSVSQTNGEEMILFQEISSVFGASKYEQKPSEAPASITVITADEIERHGYRTLAGNLRSVRGFFTTYDRNFRDSSASLALFRSAAGAGPEGIEMEMDQSSNRPRARRVF